MEFELGPDDFPFPVPRTFWRWAALAGVIGAALGVWIAGRPAPAPGPDTFFVVLERIFNVYALVTCVLVAHPRTRHLGLLLFMGMFIFLLSFIAGFGIYWTVPALRTVR